MLFVWAQLTRICCLFDGLWLFCCSLSLLLLLLIFYFVQLQLCYWLTFFCLYLAFSLELCKLFNCACVCVCLKSIKLLQHTINNKCICMYAWVYAFTITQLFDCSGCQLHIWFQRIHFSLFTFHFMPSLFPFTIHAHDLHRLLFVLWFLHWFFDICTLAWLYFWQNSSLSIVLSAV